MYVTMYLPPRHPPLRWRGRGTHGCSNHHAPLRASPLAPCSRSPRICQVGGQAAPYLPQCTLALPTHSPAGPWHSLTSAVTALCPATPD